MKLNIFRRIVNGRGTMSSMKSAISATSSKKTWIVAVSNAHAIKQVALTYETVVESHDCGPLTLVCEESRKVFMSRAKILTCACIVGFGCGCVQKRGGGFVVLIPRGQGSSFRF